MGALLTIVRRWASLRRRGFLGPDTRDGAGDLRGHQLDADARLWGISPCCYEATIQQAQQRALVLHRRDRQRPQALAAPQHFQAARDLLLARIKISPPFTRRTSRVSAL